ncbi:MAG TPA: hypothetical protein VF666_08910 [Pyrinomonadaceae bacterium]|jgi:hypothetical protein
MTSAILCIAAFAFAYIGGRRSLVAGLVTVMSVGYFYGILRANLPETYSHFIFDAAVVGLYAAQLFRKGSREGGRRDELLKIWVGVLIGWPFLLFFVPVQDYAVQLVGLRGNVFLLPFILLGARLKAKQMYKLALALAVLNLIAFGFACAEFTLGVERFLPQNAVTELIYRSAVDEDYTNPNRSTALRIPATFTGAHAFAGALVLTLPILFGAWALRKERAPWEKNLLNAAMVASILGVFMAAARSPVIILAIIIAMIFLSGRLRAQGWVLFFVMLVGISWIVSSEERLQRFMTLKDVDYVSERIHWSVNENFLELMYEYPLGNGLGGGGTSMPYFLQGRVAAPTYYMENEYGRIVLEQGVLGLCLWAAFIVWVFGRGAVRRSDEWHTGRRLLWVTCAAFFATGMIGTGLLTSIPGTALLLLSVGWVAVRQPRHVEETSSVAEARGEGVEATLAERYV